MSQTDAGSDRPPRYAPQRSLPPYSYVPGKFPHPTGDPNGHSYGREPRCESPPDERTWRTCEPYLEGVDLFNHGFYWESHEAWEAVWHATRSHPPLDKFFKMLIKFAAAGVKCREGRVGGVVSHARRARALAEELAAERPAMLGLELAELARNAEDIADQAERWIDTSDGSHRVVFPFRLEPS